MGAVTKIRTLEVVFGISLWRRPVSLKTKELRRYPAAILFYYFII